ncbi:MAG: TetR/AcrR family transcriptional regulator [Gammaproteobacteria bacterium]|nr:TetR/AcrR family transcriptional regulator [Gammaproteobacteria bacterium]MBU0787036.1 TetR/AcrR family transcriptional regulator [Gammaproteobacteria bacterium]MBU0816287.1 TetR/AcrR family transcriptional regulator [Gammaproteobacteria bacterium]MBU1787924.1 TetR/AcrR family transcriptional regulator [Gammaproteobacteria bacterium]
MHVAREEAIVQAVNRLLAEKGFDAMTVDEVAAEVGIAKASLYRHFPSKEDLAAAAMVRVLEDALAFIKDLDANITPLQSLQAVVRWALQVQLAGAMPTLPSTNSSLHTALTKNQAYLDRLMEVSERLGAWIEAAQANRSLDGSLPPIAILYTLYARACDPVPGFLKGTGEYTDEAIVELVLRTCFQGLNTR